VASAEVAHLAQQAAGDSALAATFFFSREGRLLSSEVRSRRALSMGDQEVKTAMHTVAVYFFKARNPSS
jgi:hypothetical protein